MTKAKGILSLPVPEEMRLPAGPAGTEPVHHNRSDPNDPTEIRVTSTDVGAGEFIVGSTAAEDLAIRCRRAARQLPPGSRERREEMLRANFYEMCGHEVVINPSDNSMRGPPEALRNAALFFRDKAKYTLSPELAAYLAEGD